MTLTAQSAGVPFADLAAKTVLAATGRQLRRLMPRSTRGDQAATAGVEQWQWHTALPVDQLDLDNVLGRAFRLIDTVPLDGDTCVREEVEAYVRVLVAAQQPHDTAKLSEWMRRAGCLTDG